MPGNDNNTKLLLHANGGDGVKSAFAHLKMNQTSGTTITDDGTGANDGNSSTDAANLTVSGLVGNAFQFNGVSEYIEVNDLHTDIASDTIGSISLWFYSAVPSGSEYLISFGDTSGTFDQLQISLFQSGADIDVYAQFDRQAGSPNAGWSVNSSASSSTASAWHHVVLVQDGVLIKLYVDTVLATTYPASSRGGEWFSASANLDNGRIGCLNTNGGGNTGLYAGIVDDVRYYKCVLPTAEIATLYNSTAGTEKSIILDASAGGHTEVQTYGDAQLDSSVSSDLGTTGVFRTAYLTAPDSDDWFTGTGNFTVECWVNWKGTPYGVILEQWSGVGTTYNQFLAYFAGDITIDCRLAGVVAAQYKWADTFAQNRWYHIAIVRNGTTMTYYKDGVDQIANITVNTAVSTNSIANIAYSLGIGGRNDGSGLTINANLDEVRFSKGTARYTSGFTPSTTPFTSDANTQLLLHFSENTDDSGNTGHTITNNSVTFGGAKWNTAALTFDGTGDYVTIPDSADWDIFGSLTDNQTIDYQIRVNDNTATDGPIGQYEDVNNRWYVQNEDTSISITGKSSGQVNFSCTSYLKRGTGISQDAWNHIAVIKVGNKWGVYLNGVQEAFNSQMWADTFSGPLDIGSINAGDQVPDGNMDEVRIQADNYFLAAPNSFPAAPLLLYGEGVDEATTMSNDGYSGAVTMSGGAKLDDGQKKFNSTTSIFFDGTSDYLTVVDTSGTDYDVVGSATDSWTIDLWYSRQGAGSHAWEDLINHSESGSDGWWLFHTPASGGLNFSAHTGGAPIITTGHGGVISDSSWHHVALVKSGSKYGTYLDGVQTTFVDDSSVDTYTAASLLISKDSAGASGFVNGYMEQVQITKGNKFGVVPMPEPYAHYKMNDNASNTIVVDDRGSNNGTAASNTDTMDVTGRINGALDIGGADYINIDGLAAVKSDTVGSISIWTYRPAQSGSHCMFAFGDSSAVQFFRMELVNDGFRAVSYVNGSNYAYWHTSASQAAKANVWENWVFTQDGVTGKIYRNGVEMDKSEGVLGAGNLGDFLSVLPNIDNARIGSTYTGSNSNLFNGYEDDVRYYRTALTSTQVSQIYNKGIGSELTYPVGLTVPTAVLTQDTITEPTEEYSPPDKDVPISAPLTLTLSQSAPTHALKYSEPSSLASLLSINAPTLLGSIVAPAATIEMTSSITAPSKEILKSNPTILTLTATAEEADGQVTFLDATQSISLTLNTPVMRLYDLPSVLAGLITINAPVPIITKEPSVVPITLTLENAIANPTATPTTIEGTLGILGPIPNAITTATTLNLTLTINAPSPIISASTGIGVGGALPLTISAGFSPTIGNIQPTIVRYIKDPIVTGGCPQCGTFLYKEYGATKIDSDDVFRGRNFSIRKEDEYYKCSRCNFLVKVKRHPSHPKGSKTGWGMKYDEIEAGEE